MARADEAVALDVAVADTAAVVWADVVHDDQAATAQAGDRDRADTVAGRDQGPHGNEADLVERHAPVVGVVAELVDDLGLDRGHGPSLGAPSDVKGQSPKP